MSTILTSRIGLEQLPSAFGQTQLIAGIASIIGPPLHGKFYDFPKRNIVNKLDICV